MAQYGNQPQKNQRPHNASGKNSLRGQIPKDQRCDNITDPVERRLCSAKSMQRKNANVQSNMRPQRSGQNIPITPGNPQKGPGYNEGY